MDVGNKRINVVRLGGRRGVRGERNDRERGEVARSKRKGFRARETE